MQLLSAIKIISLCSQLNPMISKRTVIPCECPQETRHEQHFLCTSKCTTIEALRRETSCEKKRHEILNFLMQTWVHQISRAHSSWENFNQVVSRPISYVAMSRCQKSRFYDLCMIFFYSVLVLIGPIWLFTCDSPTVNATVHTNSIIYSLLYYFFQTKMIFQIQLNRSD